MNTWNRYFYLVTVLAALAAVPVRAAEPRPPNVILILADDK